MKQNPKWHWIFKLIPAIIMLQTLFFKFSGAEESVYIFTQMGIEPWGRIGTGILELIASVLILIPATTFLGAGLGLGLMSGALLAHLTTLGFEVKGDGGQLFYYALITALCCLVLLWLYRGTLSSFLGRLAKK
jgi:uncharacterized membrane protein YphA (DoxX/SURF4 family)